MLAAVADRYIVAFYELFAYAWEKVHRDEERFFKMVVVTYGPVRVYMDDVKVAFSTIFSERTTGTGLSVEIPVRKEWNHLVLRFARTKAGFCGEFGIWVGKLAYYFTMPFPELESQKRVLHTQAMEFSLESLPTEGLNRGNSQTSWLLDFPGLVRIWNAMALFCRFIKCLACTSISLVLL